MILQYLSLAQEFDFTNSDKVLLGNFLFQRLHFGVSREAYAKVGMPIGWFESQGDILYF